MRTEVEPLEYGIGRRVRELREDAGITLDQFATRAREHGLRWTTARVLEFEKGQIRLTLPVLLVVAHSLGSLRGDPVHLAELVPRDVEWLRVTDEWLVRPRRVAGVFDGDAVALGNITAVSSGPVPPEALVEDALNATLAETRAAKRLGVRPRQVAMMAHLLWGWHLDDQVHALAKANSTAQERGHISRTLVAEIGRQLEHYGAQGVKGGEATDADR